MSGPSTAVYDTAGDVLMGASGLSAVMLAARAIQEAHDMYVEYGEAHQRVIERETARHEAQQQLQAASQAHVGFLHQQADRLQTRLTRLQSVLSDETPETLSPPAAADDEQAWQAYFQQLDAAIQRAESQLAIGEGMSAQTRATLLAEQPDTAQLLIAYAQQRALQTKLTAAEIAHYQALSLHLLARLEQPAGLALPIRIESLAREMLRAYDVARADALASDLRLAIQRANEHRHLQQADAAEATLLLTQLADALPEALRTTLLQVSAGAALLDDATRTLANEIRAAVKAARQREEQTATAVVLEQSLRDLGYEVEDIAQTLFVSGGIVHFQKQSWENYHVRMRVNPKDQTVNFNVVRPKEEAAADKRQDYLAEDRWCSEFPALLKTLAARGVNLNVTRLLQAGEVPVQVVDAATLPAARQAEEQQQHRTVEAKQMKL
ncbi:MAG: hypothetical protein PHU06_01725 [Gallionella sp.]|nr:hypothetical protein [Gallionella sp.]MDD4957833.1 hypothetical protein [Gallionella sp.]